MRAHTTSYYTQRLWPPPRDADGRLARDVCVPFVERAAFELRVGAFWDGALEWRS